MDKHSRRRRLIGAGASTLIGLCCVGVLGIRLATGAFPVHPFSPRLDVGQPLGAGQALAFSIMRVDVLRPFQLCVLDDDSGVRCISRGLIRSDISPLWSPDGTQIAYQSVSGRATRYHLVGADGANRREITLDDGYKALLQWSPDGSRLAYVAYGRHPDGAVPGSTQLCITDLSTGDTQRTPVADVEHMVWSPDGRSLTAIVRADDRVSIARYDVMGSREPHVASAAFLQEAAYSTLSPDARRVAYVVPSADGPFESMVDSLYVAALDGSTTASLAVRWVEGAIAWSPDSAKIAFVALTDEAAYALYVARADGAGMQELMLVNEGDGSGEIMPAAPAWSPDGKCIAISSVSGPATTALYVMDADGTARRQVAIASGSGAMVYDLAWRPDARAR